MTRQQRIGILSDSFDPVHCEQIRVGLNALNAGMLDLLIVVPAADSPCSPCDACADDRWKMLVSACACDDRLIPSRIEMERSESVSLFKTLTVMKKQYPGADLCNLIGYDVLKSLLFSPQLRNILKLCSFLIYLSGEEADAVPVREALSRLAELGGRFRLLSFDTPGISPSSVPASFTSRKSLENLDPSVLEYCICKGLYGCPRRIEHIDAWIDRLFASLKPRRFAHSLSVALTARQLAEHYGLDPLKAEQAGLLHDCAKCLPLSEMKRIAAEHHLTDDSTVFESSALLHSLVGAWLAEKQYGITDQDILDSIRYHNTGMAGMSRLAMCVCLSDSIEPLRQSYPLLDQVRDLSMISLERSLLLSLEGTAEYVKARGKYLHPRTLNTIGWLKQLPAVQKST